MNDCTGREVNVGDFVVYATKTESPSLQFAYIVEFKEVPQRWSDRTTPRMKLWRSSHDGTRITKTVVDVPGHWREDAPAHISDYRSGYRVTSEDRKKYYVNTTYVDTGKPDTVWLDCASNNDHRLMVISPVV